MQYKNNSAGIEPVKLLHPINVQEKLVTLGQFANKFAEIVPVRFLQPLNKLANDVQFIKLSLLGSTILVKLIQLEKPHPCIAQGSPTFYFSYILGK